MREKKCVSVFKQVMNLSIAHTVNIGAEEMNGVVKCSFQCFSLVFMDTGVFYICLIHRDKSAVCVCNHNNMYFP